MSLEILYVIYFYESLYSFIISKYNLVILGVLNAPADFLSI